MTDLSILSAAGLGGGVTLVGQGVVAWIRGRLAAAQNRDTLDAGVEQHRDRLTFDLLQAAREEVALARKEAQELRYLQSRLHHFDEAIERIVALLSAQPNAPDYKVAERQAHAFLARMKRIQEDQNRDR